MNNTQDEQITTFQVLMFFTNFIFGAGILLLPRSISEKVKTPDSWITVIISGILVTLMTLLLVKLSKRYPNESIYQFNQHIVGKWLGFLINIIIIVYYVTLAAFEVRILIEATEIFLLPGTPGWAIAIPFLWIGLYLVNGGISSLAKMLEILFPITVIVFLLVVFLGIGIIEIDNLRPVLGSGIKPVINGVVSTSLSYVGFEIILFVYMYMKEKNKAAKIAVVGVGITTIFYLVTVVAVVGAFSVNGVLLQVWPVISYVRSYEIVGLFFERFDALLLLIWIMQIFTTYIISLFVAAQGMAHTFKKRNNRPFLFAIIPVIYIIAMAPRNINEAFLLGGLIGKIALYLFFVTPILLLFVDMIREKMKKST